MTTPGPEQTTGAHVPPPIEVRAQNRQDFAREFHRLIAESGLTYGQLAANMGQPERVLRKLADPAEERSLAAFDLEMLPDSIAIPLHRRDLKRRGYGVAVLPEPAEDPGDDLSLAVHVNDACSVVIGKLLEHVSEGVISAGEAREMRGLITCAIAALLGADQRLAKIERDGVASIRRRPK